MGEQRVSSDTQIIPGVINAVVEEIEALAVENVKHWRELQIQTYWHTGETLRKVSEEQGIGITELVSHCSKDERLNRIRMGHASLWFGVQLFDRYPSFEEVYNTVHGQNVSVTKLKLLMSGKEEEPPGKPDEQVVKNFIKKHGYEKALRLAKAIVKATEKGFPKA